MKKSIYTIVFTIATGLVLTACGVTQKGTIDSSVEAGTSTKAVTLDENHATEAAAVNVEAGFPLRIEHAYGETVLFTQPERVVAISWENGDTPLALGIAPVGVSEANYGARTENRLHAWTDAAFQKLGIHAPKVFNDTDGWDYEAIADANPDVILCAYSGITQEEYDTLSQIAPVVPYKEEAFQTTWRAQTIENATALGLQKDGERLVEETDALIRKKAASYPEIAGKKTAFMWFSAEDLSRFYVYLPADPRAAYLEDLGMILPESIYRMAEGQNAFSLAVSRERAEELKDVEMIVMYGDSSLLEALQNDKLLLQIPAIKNGAVVLLDQNTDLAAGVTPSILSIPYTIDDYYEALREAAEKVQ